MKLLKRSLLIFSVFAAMVTQTKAQTFRNLDFELACSDSKTGLCHWDRSWGGELAGTADKIHGNQRLLITGKSGRSVGFVEQTLELEPTSEVRILEVTALVETEKVAGKGGGLNLGTYDQEGTLTATIGSGGLYGINWLTGTRPAKKVGLQIVCPVGTTKIKIGGILYGEGKAWFDDFEVSFYELNDRQPNELATAYIDEALKVIRENSLYRDGIDEEALRTMAGKIAGSAEKPADCYLAVRFLLESLRPLGDNHSFFMTATEVDYWKNDEDPEESIQYPTFKQLDGVGYVWVPGFHAGSDKLIVSYADSLQSGLRQLNNQGIEGWIVDLRDNDGGNMEPMILGLGPLLDPGNLGSLKDVNGNHEHWNYKEGTYYWEEEKLTSVTAPLKIKDKKPIAVLTSSQTGSSGEVVAISFIGNSNTMSLGEPTWGLTTGNGSFDLSDGARIQLASTVMVDRNGKAYKGPIEPDKVISNDKNDKEQDETLEEALKWIRSKK